MTIAAFDPIVALRLMCGFFLAPHAIGKLREPGPPQELFAAVGLRPPRVWLIVIVAFEFAAAACLVLDAWTKVVAAATAVFLCAAGAAVLKLGRAWRWNVGGAEYPFFWALCCLIVALKA